MKENFAFHADPWVGFAWMGATDGTTSPQELSQFMSGKVNNNALGDMVCDPEVLRQANMGSLGVYSRLLVMAARGNVGSGSWVVDLEYRRGATASTFLGLSVPMQSIVAATFGWTVIDNPFPAGALQGSNPTDALQMRAQVTPGSATIADCAVFALLLPALKAEHPLDLGKTV